MGLLDRLSANEAVRAVVLPLMRRANFDFTVSHPWVAGSRLRLNSYRHKGYWFFGRRREYASMELFAGLIKGGDNIAEVGGHIGFISGYFAKLAGSQGLVTVFEPGSNNLPYLRHNAAAFASNAALAPIELIEKAVGPAPGMATLYEDDLTGQNNSIVQDFNVLASNSKSAHVVAKVTQRQVGLVTIDAEFCERALHFVKIDVEGFEFGVLQGMLATLRNQQPVVMVEVQASEPEILSLFNDAGYRLFTEHRVPATLADQLRGNMFALHPVAHAGLIETHFAGR